MDKLHEEKLRAEFEKQIREDLLFDDEELEWQTERNCYAIYGVHLAWWGYRASLVNLVVDLPQRQSLCASGYGDGYFVPSDYGEGLEYDETVEALRSIGLSIKGE